MGREGSQCSALPTQQLRTPEAGACRMKRQVPGLAETARDSRPEIPDGIFLVRVAGAQFRWHAQKPFYVLRLSILEPGALTGRTIIGCRDCAASSRSATPCCTASRSLISTVSPLPASGRNCRQVLDRMFPTPKPR